MVRVFCQLFDRIAPGCVSCEISEQEVDDTCSAKLEACQHGSPEIEKRKEL